MKNNYNKLRTALIVAAQKWSNVYKGWNIGNISLPSVMIVGIAGMLFAYNAVAFFPGYMSGDSLSNLLQARGELAISGLQPILLPLLWRCLIFLTGNISSFLFVQLAMLWIALCLLALYAYGITKKM